FLVQDGICSNGSFSCLTVSDDQLTLSPSDREHRVDSQDTCLQWYGNGFTVNNTRGIIFHRTVIIRLDLSFSIDGSTQGVYYPSDKAFAYGNTGSLFSTGYLCTLTDTGILTENNNTDLIFLNILNHT